MNLKMMFFKKSLALVVAGASIALVVTAFLGPDTQNLITSVFKEEIRNSLSGRVGTDGPILIVKIDDTKMAHPQIVSLLSTHRKSLKRLGQYVLPEFLI
jgi:hypothetical protein